MQVPELLLKTLDDLGSDDLKTFQWYCVSTTILDSCKPIPKARLEKASRVVTVSKLTEAYGEELAVSLTVEILKKMYNSSLALELQTKYGAIRSSSTSSTSSSAQSLPAAPPAAPGAPGASIVAQQGSVIYAPTFINSTTGGTNVNMNQPRHN